MATERTMNWTGCVEVNGGEVVADVIGRRKRWAKGGRHLQEVKLRQPALSETCLASCLQLSALELCVVRSGSNTVESVER